MIELSSALVTISNVGGSSSTNVDAGDTSHFTDEISVVVGSHNGDHDVSGDPLNAVVLTTHCIVVAHDNMGDRDDGHDRGDGVMV